MLLLLLFFILILILLTNNENFMETNSTDIIINIPKILDEVKYFTNNKKKIAIITSIYNNYDNLKEQNINNKNDVDWYCFTDNINLKSTTWKNINKPYHLLNTNIDSNKEYKEYKEYKNYYNNIKNPKIYSMMCAKYYKIKTHEIDILQDYDYYIWIDGTIILHKDFISKLMILINQDNMDLINFTHPSRTNIHDESIFSEESTDRYKEQKVIKQKEIYHDEGFPDNLGLFALSFIIKKNNKYINNIFDNWWIENLKYSYQDQISYPYVLWKFKKENENKNDYKYTKPDYVINEDVYNNNNYNVISGHL